MKADSTAVVAAAARDAETRSVSALKNAAGAAALRQHMAALNSALANGNITGARRSLADARSAIQAARSQLAQFPGDAPDLTAIELALLQVENALK